MAFLPAQSGLLLHVWPRRPCRSIKGDQIFMNQSVRWRHRLLRTGPGPRGLAGSTPGGSLCTGGARTGPSWLPPLHLKRHTSLAPFRPPF